jgi:hypothetical protein
MFVSGEERDKLLTYKSLELEENTPLKVIENNNCKLLRCNFR